MIKWFCDICSLEITAPEHPVRVKAYRCGKNRDDADIGWGEEDVIFTSFCHKRCADRLETEVRNVFAAVKTDDSAR